eukprot:scaffold176677_cov46-Tisochrysis_lutea.AAC.1
MFNGVRAVANLSHLLASMVIPCVNAQLRCGPAARLTSQQVQVHSAAVSPAIAIMYATPIE